MDDNMRSAILMARTAKLNAEVAGMIAANTERQNQGYALAYSERSFLDAIDENKLGENDVIALVLHGEY